MNQARRPIRPISYADSGVDIAAGNALVNAIKPIVRSTRRPGANADIGGFGGLFDLRAAGYRDPILVAATDGVGTKLKVAIETGIVDTVGIDLVAMCVNDLIVQGAEPLFFLDYYATGKLDPNVGTAIIAGIAEGCRQAGAALIGGETAEMPGMYSAKDFDLAGFAVGAVERGDLLPRNDIIPGDVVLALASSGVHSNGFSLVRKLVSDFGLSWGASAPFDRHYSLGEALLTPTRIYVKPIHAALKGASGVKALAHITGGGLTENVPRVLPPHTSARIDLTTLPMPPVFRWLGGLGDITEPELLRTFNCGVGMAIVTASDDADSVALALTKQGETVLRIGQIEDGDGTVRYHGSLPIGLD